MKMSKILPGYKTIDARECQVIPWTRFFDKTSKMFKLVLLLSLLFVVKTITGAENQSPSFCNNLMSAVRGKLIYVS